MKNIFKYFLLFITVLSLGLSSCEDDKYELSRLFRPEFITSSFVTEANNITLVWKVSNEAESYTIELSRDVTFEGGAEFSKTITKTKHTFANLLFNTEYYARVKANNVDPGKNSNWTVTSDPIKTRERVIPNILQVIEPSDIGETSVTLRWIIDPENPVDSLSITTQGDTPASIEFKLTDAQIQAGELYVSGLEMNTSYTATVSNSKANEDSRNYNSRTFRTVGPPSEAIILSANDNFAKILQDELDNPARAELTFYLPAGADFYMFNDNSFNLDENGKVISLKSVSGRSYNITKSVTILGAPGAKRPTLWMRSGKWQITADITKFIVDGVNAKEFISEEFNQSPSNGTYWFNFSPRTTADGPITIGEFAIKNSEIKGFHRGIFMCNNDNADGASITINKVTMDNCIYSSGTPYEGFGVFQINKKNTDIWTNISIRNSTFYDCLNTRGLFGATTANTLIQQRGNILIENCTFVNFGPSYGGLYISQLPNPGVNVTINNCLVGAAPETNTKEFCVIGTNNSLTSTNNYYVSGWTVKSNDMPLSDSGLTPNELFTDYENGNFVIKNTESDIYKYNIGDPRWIK